MMYSSRDAHRKRLVVNVLLLLEISQLQIRHVVAVSLEGPTEGKKPWNGNCNSDMLSCAYPDHDPSHIVNITE
jgi:hypothetical protein